MNTKHTPEPWHVSSYDSENGTPASIAGNGGPICSMHRRNPDNAANACLILAAPRMLEALRDLLETCLSRGEKLGLDGGGPVLEKARNAIAAATGEVQS